MLQEADLAGKKEAEQLTPEEKEALEEAGEEERMMFSGMEEGPKPGEPVFLFVAKVSEEEKSRLLGEAFTKAKAHALLLARAAGVELGGLQTVASQGAGDGLTDYEALGEYGVHYRNILYPLVRRARTEQSGNDTEAIGIQPGQVSLRAVIVASFAIQ